MKKENNKLKDELIDIQMKSMQNNLIFYNIKETEEEICSEIIGSETWLQENNFINIEKFEKKSCLCRNKNIGTRNEGGLAVYCKQHLCKGISVEKEVNHGILLLKLEHTFFNTTKDVFVCFSYIPHEKSKYYNICDIDFHEIIESIVLDYSEKGIVLICGDFNSRIGEVSDVLYNDQLDKFVTSVNHLENPIISDRCSMDKVVNTFGRKLLQVCYNTGLTISNGRLGSDTNGQFTLCNSKGTSVNDYLLVSPNNYGIISDFEVLEMNEFSDHMPLFF
ncbi:unnamed protein product [Mytilus coruscus]|uniref:Endonuclease/exonuclease/phosphatase domain-containing protein n=1 Tax=Mytilus coruscus TaxID=42192 RepID=A0A6J8EDY1_MYTCO|nr:unnamed protein product [Mytilus coruscus]